MAVEGTAARAAAVTVLGAVLGDGMPLSQIDELDLPVADRARAGRLALTVLRHLEQADRVLAPHLRKSPPLEVRNVLRLAVVEFAVEGAAAHGVVNAAVELVRRGNRTGHLTGLVNAVLRKVVAMEAPFAGLPPQRIPMWLRQPLVRHWGREVVTAIEAVQALAPPLDLSPRGVDAVMPEGLVLPNGSTRLTSPGQVTGLPGYAEGHWWVQDAAAAFAVRVLDPQQGERVLDLCAAPGGKTMQIAATGADVTAVDISGPRLARLYENLARTGLSAKVIVEDALQWQPDAAFDAIFLDAPCSATGTLRRHPDLAFVRDGGDLATLTALQAQLIDRALGFLRPGGRLVFATCSLFPEEGEAQLTAALARHPGLSVEQPKASGIAPEWITQDGGLRLRPDYWADQGGMDGFFIARLRKPD
jgi:16S rRNA (cytosine967-C5)-methyltransferase